MHEKCSKIIFVNEMLRYVTLHRAMFSLTSFPDILPCFQFVRSLFPVSFPVCFTAWDHKQKRTSVHKTPYYTEACSICKSHQLTSAVIY